MSMKKGAAHRFPRNEMGIRAPPAARHGAAVEMDPDFKLRRVLEDGE